MAVGVAETKPESKITHENDSHTQPEPRRLWLVVSLAIFAVTLAILWWNAAPSVTFHDSGEFAMAAATGGIPHPPGAPTWTALATLFVKLGGFSDPAYGTNLFSGFCGAITLALLCWLMQFWIYRLLPGQPKWLAPIAGIASVIALLYSSAFLEQSFATEQYTLLTALVMAMLITATMMPERSKTAQLPVGLSVLLGLFWGLAIGNHLSQLAMGLLVVWAVFTAIRKENRVGDFIKLSAGSALGLMIGLLIFLWLPIRSHANPLIDWGNVETWDRFIWAITRRQWENHSISQAFYGFSNEWMRSYDIIGQSGLLALVLAIPGIILMAKSGKVWLGWLAASIIPYAVGILVSHLRQDGMDITYIISYGVVDWHLPIYLGVVVLAGTGFAYILYTLDQRGLNMPAGAFAFVVIALLMVSAGFSIKRSSLRSFIAPQEFMQTALAPIPSNAIILAAKDNTSFMLSYDKYVMHPNKDNQWIGVLTKELADFMNQDFTKNKIGDWRERYLREINMRPEKQILRVPPPTPERAKNSPVFVDMTFKGADNFTPVGIFYEFKGRHVSDEEVLKAEYETRAKYPETIRHPKQNSHRLERDAWATFYRIKGYFFGCRKMWREATFYYKLSLEWVPEDGYMWFCFADALDSMGETEDAFKAYKQSLKVSPYLLNAKQNLAILYARTGNFKEAERLLMEVVDKEPSNKTAAHNLRMVREDLKKSQH